MKQNKDLASVTDVGVFENIAHDILRKQNDRYAQINQTGVNKKGKPIGDPVDGITFIQDENGKIIEAIIVECTTTQKSNLTTKFLNENPKELGDVIKAKLEFEKHKAGIPELKCTLIVCFNESDSSDIEKKVKTYCSDHSIIVDIWSYSRLNDFLENHPKGQYIRYNNFGKLPISTSEELIQEVIKSNFEEYKVQFSFTSNNVRTSKAIQRDLFKKLEEIVYIFSGLILLKGESGYGKTTLCFQLFEHLIENNFYVLRVSPDLILNSNSIYEAIDKLFKSNFPELIDSPSEIILNDSLVVFIDDINRANDPRKVLDKIQNWVNASNGKNELKYTIICPAWNRNVLIKLENKDSTLVQELSLTQYSDSELLNLIELHNISADQAAFIKNEISNDPYLLGLYLSNPDKYSINSKELIKEYVNDELEKLCSSGNILESEVYNAIEKLVYVQLKQKKLYPNENDLFNWSNNQAINLDLIKSIEKESALFYFEKNQSDVKKLFFKHDRLHEYFIVFFIRKLIIENNIDESILFEPYFSDYVGKALVNIHPNEDLINLIFEKQPLIWFYYLFYCNEKIDERDLEFYNLVLKKTINWFKRFTNEADESNSRCNAIVNVLYHLNSTIALQLTTNLKFSRDKTWIRFKSGDPLYGIYYFYDYMEAYSGILGNEPATHNPQRDRLIKKYRTLYLNESISIIKRVLYDNKNGIKVKKAALLFAGYLASEKLVPDLIRFFENYFEKKEIIEESIWAMLNCCKSSDLGLKMKPFIKVLETASNAFIQRLEYALDNINNEFLDEFIIDIYLNNNILTKQFYNLLRTLDSIEAVRLYLEDLAKRKNYNLDKQVMLNLSRLHLNFSNSPRYSDSTLAKIKNLSNEHKDEKVRKFAFKVWSSAISVQNLNLLQQINEDSPFYDKAIYRRLELGDKTVLERAFPILKKNFFHGSYLIWSKELFDRIFKYLNNCENMEIRVHDYLLCIPEYHSEQLLEKYYNILGNDKKMFQYCLFIGTEKLLIIAKNIFDETEIKEELFSELSLIISSSFNYRTVKLNITRLDILKPYLKHFSPQGIHSLCLDCKPDFSTWARENLLPILQKIGGGDYLFYRLFPQKNDLLIDFFKTCRCNCNDYCKLNDWIRNLTSKGCERSEFINVLKDSLTKNNCIQKYKDVGAALRRIGNRSDLKMLEENIIKNKLEECEKIIDDVRFGIEVRTLE